MAKRKFFFKRKSAKKYKAGRKGRMVLGYSGFGEKKRFAEEIYLPTKKESYKAIKGKIKDFYGSKSPFSQVGRATTKSRGRPLKVSAQAGISAMWR